MKWQYALKDYKHYLKIERGLSQNSITNYEFDIMKLIQYLESILLDAFLFSGVKFI